MRFWILPACLLLAALPAQALQSFDSGDIAPGASYSFTFTEENVDGYSYHCHPHPFMMGMVYVLADSDGQVVTHDVRIVQGATTDDWGYSVEHLTVEVGDTVVWTNDGDLVHTVTRSEEGMDHDHGTDTSHDDAAEGSPGVALVGTLAAIGAVLVLRRR